MNEENQSEPAIKMKYLQLLWVC